MRSTQHHKPEFLIRSRQRGAVILLVTFSLIAFLGLAALVIDLGRMYIVKSQLQNAADAGALNGAKQLNGTKSGIGNALAAARTGAGWNAFLLAVQVLDVNDATQLEVRFARHPFPPNETDWKAAGDPALNLPNDYYYIRVIAKKTGVPTLFGRVLGTLSSDVPAVAIAGRYSPFGQVMPLLVPVVRRNADQFTGADCNGLIYNTTYKNTTLNLDYSTNCPSETSPWDDHDPKSWWRGWDRSGNWGFLKPGEVKCSDDYTGVGCTAAQRVYKSSSPSTQREVGGWYKVNLKPIQDSDIDNYSLEGKAWKGNFGYLLSGEKSGVRELLGALCKGTIESPQTSIPGCREVLTGAKVSEVATALNTRFENPGEANPFKGNLKDYSYDICTPDANIKSYTEPPPSAYGQYEPPPVPSPESPTKHDGAHGRRVVNLFVVDNAWLRGYTDHNNSPCTDKLQGTVKPGHIVGCAKFFMWQPVSIDPSEQGTAYLEFIDRVSNEECKAGAKPASYAEIRLFR